MTATTVKGIEITNIESNPSTILDKKITGSPLLVSTRKIEVATTSIDETADVMLICEVPSHAVIDSIKIKNDDLDSNGSPTLAVDVGVYYSGLDGNQVKEGRTSGEEIDVDLFASADTSLQAANLTYAEITNEAQNIDNYATELWEAAGLSEDPGGTLYIGTKVTTVSATPAAGAIIMKVSYR